jgi:hypothetical protein
MKLCYEMIEHHPHYLDDLAVVDLGPLECVSLAQYGWSLGALCPWGFDPTGPGEK